MNVSNDKGDGEQHLADGVAALREPRRPASWLSESELRRRARRRSAIYLTVAAACLLLFVVLIYLLLGRTRWSAGSSTQTSANHVTPLNSPVGHSPR